ncbi:MAG: hypothetical protein Edafosvirus3_7 [Edafosvirus sp.]|uniref:Uncharacterized protein n=1 Tax=Edafosvirus sp. TaxID=2487765 RepID=A0A3G4ZWX5_9VIRU|nr:MAG: hypothetical protein Edafosvirus3_7 [Edafosvirus sp.]
MSLNLFTDFLVVFTEKYNQIKTKLKQEKKSYDKDWQQYVPINEIYHILANISGDNRIIYDLKYYKKPKEDDYEYIETNSVEENIAMLMNKFNNLKNQYKSLKKDHIYLIKEKETILAEISDLEKKLENHPTKMKEYIKKKNKIIKDNNLSSIFKESISDDLIVTSEPIELSEPIKPNAPKTNENIEEILEAVINQASEEKEQDVESETNKTNIKKKLSDALLILNKMNDKKKQRVESRGEEIKRKADEDAQREANEDVQREAQRKANEDAQREAQRKANEDVQREAQRKANEDAQREAQRKANEDAQREAQRKANEDVQREAQRKANEDAQREAQRKANEDAQREAQRKANEDAQREAQRKANEDAQREAQRKANEDAQREAQRKANEDAQREAQRKANEDAQREAQRKANEDAQREAQRIEAIRIANIMAQRAEAKRVADAIEARRMADIVEAKRVADAIEARRVADAEETRRVVDAEAKRKAGEEDKIRANELINKSPVILFTDRTMTVETKQFDELDKSELDQLNEMYANKSVITRISTKEDLLCQDNPDVYTTVTLIKVNGIIVGAIKYNNGIRPAKTIFNSICLSKDLRMKKNWLYTTGYIYYLLQEYNNQCAFGNRNIGKLSTQYIDLYKIYVQYGWECINRIKGANPNQYTYELQNRCNNNILPNRNIIIDASIPQRINKIVTVDQDDNHHYDACGFYVQLNSMLFIELCKNPNKPIQDIIITLMNRREYYASTIINKLEPVEIFDKATRGAELSLYVFPNYIEQGYFHKNKQEFYTNYWKDRYYNLDALIGNVIPLYMFHSTNYYDILQQYMFNSYESMETSYYILKSYFEKENSVIAFALGVNRPNKTGHWISIGINKIGNVPEYYYLNSLSRQQAIQYKREIDIIMKMGQYRSITSFFEDVMTDIIVKKRDILIDFFRSISKKADVKFRELSDIIDNQLIQSIKEENYDRILNNLIDQDFIKNSINNIINLERSICNLNKFLSLYSFGDFNTKYIKFLSDLKINPDDDFRDYYTQAEMKFQEAKNQIILAQVKERADVDRIRKAGGAEQTYRNAIKRINERSIYDLIKDRKEERNIRINGRPVDEQRKIKILFNEVLDYIIKNYTIFMNPFINTNDGKITKLKCDDIYSVAKIRIEGDTNWTNEMPKIIPPLIENINGSEAKEKARKAILFKVFV